MDCLIFGATDMVGQGALCECLLDDQVTGIISVAKSSFGEHDPKFSEIVLPDLNEIARAEDQLSGFDACFFCLGISSVGMSEAGYTRVTYDLTMTITTVPARHNPGMTFIYVTGADTSQDSRRMVVARQGVRRR